MDVVTDIEHVKGNIKELERGRMALTGVEADEYRALIKRGTCFVPYTSAIGLAFAPSRFIGYVGNKLLTHRNNSGRDGRITNPAICKALGSQPLANDLLERRYLEFCRQIGVKPSVAGSFGVKRRFWITADAEAFLSGLEASDTGHEIGLTADLQEDAFSWTILSDSEAIKRVDKSVILYHGTGVPKQLLPFFGIDVANPPKSLRVIHRGKEIDLRVNVDPFQRVRLFWPRALSESIVNSFPVEAAQLEAGDDRGRGTIVMHFDKRPGAIYAVSFFRAGTEAEETVPEEYAPQLEGRSVVVETIRRMRSAINRQKAIEIHGSTCAVCGFDFEKTYGDLGRGFIEVHHLNPLGEAKEETEVNPATDLIPLCANCHRMMHRGELGVITPDKLISILQNTRTVIL